MTTQDDAPASKGLESGFPDPERPEIHTHGGARSIEEMDGPRVWLIIDGVAQRRHPEEIPELLARPDGLVWVDVPLCDHQAEHILAEVFRFPPRAVRDGIQRNPIPKVHTFDDNLFVVLHAPERGDRGHVHYLELDQFIGSRHLVTVHGPNSPRLANPGIALGETDEVSAELESGRLRPASVHDVSAAVVDGIITRLRHHLEQLTRDVWDLEKSVTAGEANSSEDFLEELFRVRHGLLAVHTIALLNHEAFGRLAALRGFGEQHHNRLTDLVDQFKHIARVAEGQKNYHQGVIEFYQTRTSTKMAIAGERLAVVASVTLPVTALSGVLGMNVIVNDHTLWLPLWELVAVMVLISTVMLIWARRNGWW
jgi:Mg2+ and Co2+ transporter CorA